MKVVMRWLCNPDTCLLKRRTAGVSIVRITHCLIERIPST